jgi:hypothetical protein
MMSEPVEIARITIVRNLFENGREDGDGDVIDVDCTEGMSMIEGLGLLELAKDTWLRSNGLRDFPEDDDDGR